MQTVQAQECRWKHTGTRDQLCLWRCSESVALSVCNESLESRSSLRKLALADMSVPTGPLGTAPGPHYHVSPRAYRQMNWQTNGQISKRIQTSSGHMTGNMMRQAVMCTHGLDMCHEHMPRQTPHRGVPYDKRLKQ